MDLVGFIIRVVVASLFVTSAAAKIHSRADFEEMLYQLGITPTRILWAFTCVIELFTAITVITMLHSYVPAALTAALGTLFAVAAVGAIRSGRTVQCACFGSTNSRPLGRVQIISLPLWLMAAVFMGSSRSGTGSDGSLVAVTLLVTLAAHLVPLVRTVRSARADRMAVAEVGP